MSSRFKRRTMMPDGAPSVAEARPTRTKDVPTAWLGLGDEDPIEVQLLDLSADGMAVSYTCDEPPAFPVGHNMNLTLRAEKAHRPLAIEGMVTSRLDGLAQRRYIFEFHNPDAVSWSLNTSPLRTLFNRRRASRVRPRSATIVVDVKDLTGARVSQGKLADISATGIAMVVPPEDEEQLSELGRVRVSFRLESSEAVSMITTIRSRTLTDGELRYGVEYDPDRTLDFDEQQERIVAWIAKQIESA